MNPTVQSIIDEDSTLQFTISNINSSLINAIRRIIISEIPCFVFRTFPYAQNKATIDINTTRFNNEIIKQRLSCIPIHINDLTFPYKDHILEVELSNDKKEIMYVTTENFKVKNIVNNTYLDDSVTKKIFPPDSITNSYIDFLRLQPQLADNIPGEQIKLSCEFDIGTAKESGTFNVTSTCAFGGTIDKEKIEEKWEEKLKTLDEEDKEDIEFIKKDWLLMEGARIVIPDSFDFIIKSIGIYSNFEILEKACSIMVNKFKKFITDLQEKILISSSHSTLENSYDIELVDESFTLGKVLEYLIYKIYFGKEVTFVGFRQPHPHINICVLKIGFNQEVDNEIIIQRLVEVSSKGIEIYEKLKQEFVDK